MMENRNYSSVYRILHWSLAFSMLFLLLTILLRLTWLNKEHVADIIQAFHATSENPISREDSITLAKQIRKPMWNWHIYTGYIITGLFCIRLLLPVFGKIPFSSPFNKNLTTKVKFQYWVYIIFFFCLAISLITGLIIEFGPENLKDRMEQIHTLSLYYLIPFILIHLAGVLMAEFTTHKGIISDMISGKKK